MRNIPAAILQQFELVEILPGPWRPGHECYRLRRHVPSIGGNEVFLKIGPLRELDLEVHRAVQDRSQSPCINRPEQFFNSGSRFHLLSRYFAAGDFRAFLNSSAGISPTPVAFTDVVRQLHDAITDLHEHCELIHCDIKPSNILVAEINRDRVAICLNDFDSATPAGAEDEFRRPRGTTSHYSAPEALNQARSITTAVDYWSLGMVLLEWVTGQHPFDGLTDEAVHLQIIQFPPDLSAIPDTSIRALLGGLLAIDPKIRFAAEHVAGWLRGDPAILSMGLVLGEESPAAEPFLFDGQQVFDAQGLAKALLTSGSGESLSDPELLDWVEVSLRRPDIRTRMEALSASDSDRELATLGLCLDLWPAMPPIWRRTQITRDNLASISRAASGDGAGSSVHSAWLRSLFEARTFDGETLDVLGHFARLARSHSSLREAAELSTMLHAAWDDYDSSWQQVVDAGAPADVRNQADDGERIIIVRGCVDTEYQNQLRDMAQSLFQAQTLLFRSDWFYTFGSSVQRVSLPKLQILAQLDRPSLLDMVPVEDLSYVEEGRLSDQVLHFQAQAKLAAGQIIRPGTEITHLRNGGRYEPFESYSFRLLWQQYIVIPATETLNWVGAILRRAGRFILRMLRVPDPEPVPNATEENEETQPEPDLPSYDAYIVPLVPENWNENSLLPSSTYLVRISWQMRQSRSLKLVVRSARGLYKRPLLKLHRLPERGHFLLCLNQDSDLRLYEKAGFITTSRLERLHLVLKIPRPRLTASHKINLAKPALLTDPYPKRVTSSLGFAPIVPNSLSPAEGLDHISGGLVEVFPEFSLVSDSISPTDPGTKAHFSKKEYREVYRQIKKTIQGS